MKPLLPSIPRPAVAGLRDGDAYAPLLLPLVYEEALPLSLLCDGCSLPLSTIAAGTSGAAETMAERGTKRERVDELVVSVGRMEVCARSYSSASLVVICSCASRNETRPAKKKLGQKGGSRVARQDVKTRRTALRNSSRYKRTCHAAYLSRICIAGIGNRRHVSGWKDGICGGEKLKLKG